jgi:hypothetical protein
MESFKLTVSCWTASIPCHTTPLELQSLGWPHHTTSCHALSIATQYCLVHAHSRIRSSTGTHYSSQYLLEIQQVYAQQRQLPQLPRACDGTDQTSLKGCHCHSLHVTAVPQLRRLPVTNHPCRALAQHAVVHRLDQLAHASLNCMAPY